ncbi:patatin-like phospholipase family protein [Blastococcus sp. SYSU DS0539]
MAGRGSGRALVLGGGGIAGIAWEIGLLAGLAEHGVDVRDADLVVGTSAGSIVGTLLRGEKDLQSLYAAQSAPVTAAEPDVEFDATAMMTAFAEALTGAAGEQDARARNGALALRGSDVPEAERRAIIAGRIGEVDWPAGRLVVTAVDTADGSFAAFDAGSGVPLVDAVAASRAVPTVWPLITIGDRRYMDGGMRSATNADLAAAARRSSSSRRSPAWRAARWARTSRGRSSCWAGAPRWHTVLADQSALQAFGTNPLSPASRQPAAAAGRAQAEAVRAEVAAFWS